MASSKQKGDQYELEVKKYLESRGYQVFKQHRKAMFIKGKIIMAGSDVFGADMIARKRGEKDIFIQVSSFANKSKKVFQVEQFPWTYEHQRVQIWGRYTGKKWFEVWEGPDFESVGTVKLGKPEVVKPVEREDLNEPK